MSEDQKHELELTERELAIAQKAARIAIEELTDDFYRRIGKTVVGRFLVWTGALALGFGWAKGWISLNMPK